MEKIEEKVWGIYNTFDNVENFNNLPEFDIWKIIDNLGGVIFWSMHDMGKPWLVMYLKKI